MTQHTTGSNRESRHGASLNSSSDPLFERLKNKKILLVSAVVVIICIFLIALFSMLSSEEKSHRTESYKKASGAAGLHAAITYDCDKKPCDKKSAFDFNVYIYKEDGQQVNVVRPDANGNVNMALIEGNYNMLIGKRFSDDKLFPQEPLALKNGQVLELKLHYK